MSPHGMACAPAQLKKNMRFLPIFCMVIFPACIGKRVFRSASLRLDHYPDLSCPRPVKFAEIDALPCPQLYLAAVDKQRGVMSHHAGFDMSGSISFPVPII